ncbi:helix-turn-helix domain-containing protein [Paracoccus sp. 22332]|uniref:helix-turn-helix domain-containing protein n=1 Tax=Paracoccus sp. 22332 TaxID=3453913 RepID=UPI003F875CDD
MKLLTEAEAAEIMRCSTSKIKRLRLGGVLPYYPGRPVLIDEADLQAYLEEVKRNAPPPPRPPLAPEEQVQENIKNARQWALNEKLKSQRRQFWKHWKKP